MTGQRQVSGGTHQRSRHAGNFVIIPNDVAQIGKPLSLRALGLLTYILSLPADKPVTTAAIVTYWPEGRDAVLKAVAELRQAGMAREFRRQNRLGHWGTKTVYYDTRQTTTERDCDQAPPEPDFQGPA